MRLTRGATPQRAFARAEIVKRIVLVIRVGESPGRGRGIFATVDIPEGTLIEECPVIVVPMEEVETLNATVLRDYHFMWGGTGEASAVSGSLPVRRR